MSDRSKILDAIYDDVVRPSRTTCWGWWMMVMIFTACVPLPQYTAVEKERNLAEEKVKNLEIELEQAEAMGIQYAEDLKNLRTQNNYLKNINRQLSENTRSLQQDLTKKQSVIQLQAKVIRLLDDTKKTIETSLKDQIAAQEIEVVEEADKLKVIFVDKILFDSGSVDITSRGKELLLIMAASIKDDREREIVVEGHTDNVPVSAALMRRFPSNWELSAARAAAVVRFLQEYGGIRPERLSVRGYSFYRPVASNESEEGRRQNRRIEIILGGFD